MAARALRHAFRVGLLVFLCCFQPTLVEAEPQGPNPALATFFDRVVFAGRSNAKIVKWANGPTVRLESFDIDLDDPTTLRPIRTEAWLHQAVDDHLRQMAALTGLAPRLLPLGLGEGGELVVSFVPGHRMRAVLAGELPARLLSSLVGPARCFFVIWPKAQSTIGRAHIVINSKLELDHINHCIIEEITQAFGVPHDSEFVRPSVFNESAKLVALEEIDKAVVSLLYNPRLRAGTSRRAALAVIEDILARRATQ